VSNWITQAGKGSILSVAKKYRTIYNWIDTNILKQRGNIEVIKKHYSIPFDKKIILGVAQEWSERKGINEFFSIAQELQNEVLILLIGGLGGYKEQKNIRFLGPRGREELIDLYSIADVFVNPSRMETFGLVTIEAMACGLPVVAYNNTGSAEILTDKCGFLIQDGNVDAMVDAVKVVIKKGKGIYSESCKSRIEEKFEKRKQIMEYISFYKEIIDIHKGDNTNV